MTDLVSVGHLAISWNRKGQTTYVTPNYLQNKRKVINEFIIFKMLNICHYNWMSTSILSLNHLCFGLKNLAYIRFSFTPSHQFRSFFFEYREILIMTMAYKLKEKNSNRHQVFFLMINLSYHIFLSVSNQVANHFCHMYTLITQTGLVSRITLQIVNGKFSHVV